MVIVPVLCIRCPVPGQSLAPSVGAAGVCRRRLAELFCCASSPPSALTESDSGSRARTMCGRSGDGVECFFDAKKWQRKQNCVTAKTQVARGVISVCDMQGGSSATALPCPTRLCCATSATSCIKSETLHAEPSSNIEPFLVPWINQW